MLRVLMLGWELPPFITGGLGTACQGLARALTRQRVEVLFVLPQPITPGRVSIPSVATTERAPLQYQPVPSSLHNPYASSGVSRQAAGHAQLPQPPAPPREAKLARGLRVLGTGAVGGYSASLMQDIEQFAQRAAALTAREEFDVIHAHDWMTFPAAMRIAHLTGKPWIAHVHATEFDRSGERVNQPIYEIERAGMHDADRVIAVSGRTRELVSHHYSLPPARIQVIHNGIDGANDSCCEPAARRQPPLVLFLGRLTQQKGPGYFIDAAERVLAETGAVKFVVAGWGDLGPALVETVAARGLAEKILFTGFLKGAQVTRAFASASIYVMPSVSEPFGLTALEAVRGGAGRR